ncbi:MAG: S8 family serine peptidase, partial [Saprospiraceae bacterium]|nr:S8 family serine peptidase [Saprospiraceae bacterium]
MIMLKEYVKHEYIVVPLQFKSKLVVNKKLIPILIFVLFAGTCLQSQPLSAPDKISSKLAAYLSVTNDEWLSVHIVLADQINYKSWVNTQDQKRSDFSHRATTLISDLKHQAETSQIDLYRFLLQSDGVQKNGIKSHWLANAISCVVRKDMISQLMDRPDVRWIGQNVTLKQTDQSTHVTAATMPPDSRERGLTAIHAPEMWALGYTGYGRKAFVADTGVDPSHPALAFQYNGILTNDHDSWFSFSDRDKPFDCDLHGTHVAGTILGLDRKTNDTIGVAFNANWIAGGILCGIGTEDNIGAFEWAMDPDNNPETTEDMPDVINNSWYDPS